MLTLLKTQNYHPGLSFLCEEEMRDEKDNKNNKKIYITYAMYYLRCRCTFPFIFGIVLFDGFPCDTQKYQLTCESWIQPPPLV